jgi:deoxyadenosine/deoxycytidine kinase
VTAHGSEDAVVAETRYIVVEGPIGVGKTSLARRLADAFECHLVEELPDANPFLERFYADPRQSALATQLQFLLNRYRQQRTLAASRDGQGIVADYLFAKDQIFAQMNLDGPELTLYREVLGLLVEPIPTPDLVIYLEARPEVLLRRLRKRNREFERRISEAYLEGLIEAYRRFFHEYTEAPVLVVNCSAIDFVEQGSDLADLIREIRSVKQGMQQYIPLGSQ